MSNISKAKTLQIFLPNGEPRGVRIAEITTRITQAVLIPRSELAEAKNRPEFKHLSLYFLFGESDDNAKPMVYIGQTEDPRKRLDQHNSQKDFWQTAILIISKTHNFTVAHTRYLEWHCIAQAKQIGRYSLHNDQSPTKPHTPEPIEADVLDAFETASTLLATLGYPIFEPIARHVGRTHFVIQGKDYHATGEYGEDGFVVHQGSIIRPEVTEPRWLPSREKLLDSGVLASQNGQIRFTQDYLFNSPSGAAVIVHGRSANGWTEWRDAQGKTLHELRRAERPTTGTFE